MFIRWVLLYIFYSHTFMLAERAYSRTHTENGVLDWLWSSSMMTDAMRTHIKSITIYFLVNKIEELFYYVACAILLLLCALYPKMKCLRVETKPILFSLFFSLWRLLLDIFIGWISTIQSIGNEKCPFFEYCDGKKMDLIRGNSKTSAWAENFLFCFRFVNRCHNSVLDNSVLPTNFKWIQ